MTRLNWRNLLAVALVLLLVFQLNALAIHEYNLRQQGYQLIYKPPTMLQSLPASLIVESAGDDLYNIALCETHFLINTLLQYVSLAIALAVLSKTVTPDFNPGAQTTFFRNDYFLSALLRRAPPA